MATKLDGFYVTQPPRFPVVLDCGDELITKQSDAAACDINNIIFQFTKTGQIDHINTSGGTYTDLPDTIDYQQSLHIIASASEAFDALPALMRKKYDNDPLVFLDALNNPKERDYLTEMGIFKPSQVPADAPSTVAPAAVVAPPAAAATPK